MYFPDFIAVSLLLSIFLLYLLPHTELMPLTVFPTFFLKSLVPCFSPVFCSSYLVPTFFLGFYRYSRLQ